MEKVEKDKWKKWSPSLIFTYKSLLIVTVQGAFSAPLVVLSSVAVFGMGEPEFFLDTWGAAQALEKNYNNLHR